VAGTLLGVLDPATSHHEVRGVRLPEQAPALAGAAAGEQGEAVASGGVDLGAAGRRRAGGQDHRPARGVREDDVAVPAGFIRDAQPLAEAAVLEVAVPLPAPTPQVRALEGPGRLPGIGPARGHAVGTVDAPRALDVRDEVAGRPVPLGAELPEMEAAQVGRAAGDGGPEPGEPLQLP